MKITFLAGLAAIFLLAACKPRPGAQQPPADTATLSFVDTIPPTIRHTNISTTPKTTGYTPDAIGNVNDFTELYTASQSRTLDSMIVDFNKRTGVQIAIVTVDSNMLGSQDFDAYTLGMANYWGIGKKDENNGILIAIAPYLHRMRIQNGYGIVAKLSDQQTKTIIDSLFIPNFKKGEFYTGTRQGLEAIINHLSKRRPVINNK